jgi:hypothetical protein
LVSTLRFETRVTGSPINGGDGDGGDDLNFFDGLESCVSKSLSSVSDTLSIEGEADRLPDFCDICAKNQ